LQRKGLAIGIGLEEDKGVEKENKNGG